MLPRRLATAGAYFQVVTCFWINKMTCVTSWKLDFEYWNTKVQISKHNYWFSESLFLNGLNLDAFMNLISECWVPPFWNPGSDKKSEVGNIQADTPNLWRLSKILVKDHLTHLGHPIRILHIAHLFFPSEISTYIWKPNNFGSWNPLFFTDYSFEIVSIACVVSSLSPPFLLPEFG